MADGFEPMLADLLEKALYSLYSTTPLSLQRSCFSIGDQTDEVTGGHDALWHSGFFTGSDGHIG